MSLTVKETGGEFYTVEAGMHQARCYGIIDIGTQDGIYGQKKQMVILWVLPECLHTFNAEVGEEPAVLSRFFGASLNEKSNLRAVLQSWRGKPFTPEELAGFEMRTVLDAPCLLNVIHQEKDGNTRAQISSVSPIMKGQEVPASPLPAVYYEIEDLTGGDFNLLPNWLRKKIGDSMEFKARNISVVDEYPTPEVTGTGPVTEEEDDVPF